MFGTNHNGRNAFGKCVSRMARMKSDEARAVGGQRIEHAVDQCLARTTSDHHKAKHRVRAHVLGRHHGDRVEGKDGDRHQGKDHRRRGDDLGGLARCLRQAV